MALKAQKMGPGTFTIGAVGTPLDLTAQVRSLRITPSASQDDPLETLSGEMLRAERTYTWELSATLIQDLTEAGMFDYTWTNKGDEVPFTFVPSTAAGRSITGTVTIDPLEVGGDVGAKNTVDLTWVVVGDPVLGDDL